MTQIRETQAHRFARPSVDWTAAGSQADDLVPVERFLEQIVAPFAVDTPVLVMVIDGMSVAVSGNCCPISCGMSGWPCASREGTSTGRGSPRSLRHRVLPYERLTGRRAGVVQRRTGRLREHPALLAHCRAGSAPVLFHKATLQESDDAVLAADVRKEIGSAHRKIVGVVINAVDDNLLKGGQIDTRWSRDEIKVLPALLHEARMARRLVVLVSDHGHVLDCRRRPGLARAASDGDRRSASRPLTSCWSRAAGRHRGPLSDRPWTSGSATA